jgi:hypothetical protein
VLDILILHGDEPGLTSDSIDSRVVRFFGEEDTASSLCPYSPKCLEEVFSEARMQDPGCEVVEIVPRGIILPDSAPASRHLATSLDTYAKFC